MRKLLGTFFGVGWIPGPAGTYASALTAALMLAAWHMGCPWWGIVLAAAGAGVLGVAAGREPEKDFGGKDPRPFVLDEAAGMLVAGLAAWTPWSGRAWLTLAAAFVWFRLMDILKPPPARQLERLPRGWGIVLDDVAAGLMALVLTLATDALLGRLIGPTT
jgi:phosphatidylglycerophosphatase A